jgi:hypothetical protein
MENTATAARVLEGPPVDSLFTNVDSKKAVKILFYALGAIAAVSTFYCGMGVMWSAGKLISAHFFGVAMYGGSAEEVAAEISYVFAKYGAKMFTKLFAGLFSGLVSLSCLHFVNKPAFAGTTL